MQRRHTSEDIQAVPAASAPRCILKSRSTDPDISAVLRRDPRGATMGCDQPIAGPSKPVFSLPPVRPLPGDEREDEDEGAPSSTPTPPPKQRTQQRNVSSASASLSRPKGGYSRFSALSESPSSLHQTTIDQMHSVDSPVFLASTPFEAEPPAGRLSSSRRSARSPEVSDIVPSPVASTTRKAASSSGDMPFPPPPREPHAPLLLPSPVSASSRLPPTLTQSPTLSKPYVMPSSTPGASQVRPVRASQRAPPPLGMRRAHGSGVSKYQVPKERPKAIKGFKIPFKDPQVNGGREASSSASEPQAGAVAAVARAQSYDASAVPDPPHAPATAQGSASVTQPPDQVPQMSARRPEPADGIDEVKEADSSYGDIPFDFDRETLDEVMSIYDG
ncbi:hypothetical protein BD414DRAFT_499342 [Trametes punicea]|nr:hypothetical protein BD414DRAFT_499342 [Trametes punicea]